MDTNERWRGGYPTDEVYVNTDATDELQFGEAGVQPVKPGVVDGAYSPDNAYDAYADAPVYEEPSLDRTQVMPGRAAGQVSPYPDAAAPYARTAAPDAATGSRERTGEDRTGRLLRKAALWLVIAAIVIVGGAIALDFGKTFVQDLADKAQSAVSSLADSASQAAVDAATQAAEQAASSIAEGVSSGVGDVVEGVMDALGTTVTAPN